MWNHSILHFDNVFYVPFIRVSAAMEGPLKVNTHAILLQGRIEFSHMPGK